MTTAFRGPINDKRLKADLVAIATELSLASSTAQTNKTLAALIQAHIDANPDDPRRSPIQPKGLGHRGQSSGDKAAEDLHQDTAGPVEVTAAHKKLLDHEIPVDPLPSFVRLTTKLGTGDNLSVQDEENGSECGIEPGANLLDNSESLLLPVLHSGEFTSQAHAQMECFWNALIFAPDAVNAVRKNQLVSYREGQGVLRPHSGQGSGGPHDSYRCNQNIRPKDPHGGCSRGMPKVPHLRREVPHSLTLAARAVLRPPLGLGGFTFSEVNLMLEKDWYECSKSSSTE
ncbi:hypothetical protein C8J56DRAFT_890597 [Mycena floridula]|nr:hypothetical protein C8J56DRAFT_890597 [Mycena floridula]